MKYEFPKDGMDGSEEDLSQAYGNLNSWTIACRHTYVCKQGISLYQGKANIILTLVEQTHTKAFNYNRRTHQLSPWNDRMMMLFMFLLLVFGRLAQVGSLRVLLPFILILHIIDIIVMKTWQQLLLVNWRKINK